MIVVEFPTNLHTVNGQWLPCKIENQDEDALAKKAEIPGGIETMRKMCRPERNDFWIAFSSTPDTGSRVDADAGVSRPKLRPIRAGRG